MANFITNLFLKQEKVDHGKLALQAHISVQNAIFDKHLISLSVQQGKLEAIQNLLILNCSIDEYNVISICEEVKLLTAYIASYKILKGEDFFIKFQNDLAHNTDYKIYPFILIPIVQNAILHGYTSMQKYPIRIKLTQLDNGIKLEVSNKVNHYIQSQGNTGILEEFKARMQILYPERHDFIVNSNSNIFKTTLILR